MEIQTTNLVPATREQNIITLKEVSEDLQVSITDGAHEQLIVMQEKYPASAIPTDLSNKANFDTVHKIIQEIKAPRLALEKSRKEVVEPLNSVTKKINAAAKPIKDAYIELENPWKKAKKDFEIAEEVKKREDAAAELDRVNQINAKIASIKALPGTHIKSDSAEVGVAIVRLEQDRDTFDFEEFSEQGLSGFTESLELLNEMYNQKVKAEDVERDLAARDAKEKAEREEREEAERVRLAEQKAEQDKVAAKLQAQQDEINRQQEEIESQKREVVEAENKRKQAEIAAEEEKKREAIRIENEKKIAASKKAAEEAEKLRAEEAEKLAKKKRAQNITYAMADIEVEFGSVTEHDSELIGMIIAGKIRHIMWLDNLEPKING